MRLIRRSHCIGQRDVARGIAYRPDLRQSKIEDLAVAPLGDEDVGRLDVTMHDPLRVRRIESVGDFHA